MNQNIKDTIAIMKLAGSIFTRSAQELEEQFEKLETKRSEQSIPPKIEVVEEKAEKKSKSKKVKDVVEVPQGEVVAEQTQRTATMDDLKDAFRNFAKVNGPQKAVEKLTELGFERLTSIPEDKIADVYASFTWL